MELKEILEKFKKMCETGRGVWISASGEIEIKQIITEAYEAGEMKEKARRQMTSDETMAYAEGFQSALEKARGIVLNELPDDSPRSNKILTAILSSLTTLQQEE